MKKFFYVAAAAMVMASSCSNGAKEAEAKRVADSIAAKQQADSIAAVEAARAEQARQDSLDLLMFAHPLTATGGKLSTSWIPNSEGFVGRGVITVTNNSDVEILPGDYSVTYSFVREGSDGGTWTEGGSSKGVAIAPNGTAKIPVSYNDAIKVKNVKVKMKVSPEELKARRGGNAAPAAE